MKNIVFACLFGSIFLSIVVANAQQQQKPNVIIIFIDDMGYGDLTCYGNKQINTKNIDELAQKGTRFTQFYVNSRYVRPQG